MKHFKSTQTYHEDKTHTQIYLKPSKYPPKMSEMSHLPSASYLKFYIIYVGKSFERFPLKKTNQS